MSEQITMDSRGPRTRITRRRSLGAALVALAGAASVAFWSGGSSAAQLDRTLEADGVVRPEAEQYGALRDAFGFDGSPAATERVANSTNGDPSLREFGFPMSPEEEVRWEERLDAFRRLKPLLRIAQELPEYAGSYRDHHDGGRTVILIASDVAATRQRLLDQTTDDDWIRVDPALYPRSALRSIVTSILEQETGRDAKRVATVGVAEIENRVEVELFEGNDAYARDLEERYGEALIVQRSAPKVIPAEPPNPCYNRFWCYNPYSGGIDIDPTYGGGCSAGFIAYSGASYYVLTAGHCDYPIVSGNAFYHANYPFGFASNNSILAGYDAVRISLAPSQASNNVYNTAGTWHETLWAESYLDDRVNDPVAKSGITTGNTAGYILQTDFAFHSVECNCYMIWQRKATIYIQDGDSGGPVGYYNGAKGLVSHYFTSSSNGSYLYSSYVHIQNATQHTNTNVRGW